MERKRRNKKAVFFSIDALIALIIIFLSILIIYPILKYSYQESEIQGDIISVLSSLKVGEIDDDVFNEFKTPENLNKSVLELIGEFYITNLSIARQLAESVLSTIDVRENIGIWYGNKLLASRNSTPIETAKNIQIGRQTISGISAEDGSVTGYSARAYLSSNMQTKYFYFGGYIGEGNLSARLEYNGQISSAQMELAINNDFEVYVNNDYVDSYLKSSSEFQPRSYDLPIDGYFHSGINIIEIRGENLHIAGGYIKIIYESDVEYEQPVRYYFPGIQGIINLYDGFYVPGQLNNLNIYLHFNNNLTTFLIIGNTTVFEDSTDGDEEITLTNSQLESLLDYNDLSQKTIPLRFGMENVSYEGEGRDIDVFSVTDLSGSMNAMISGLGKMIDLASDANRAFINIILNSQDNRVGLVGYSGEAHEQNYHSLSNDIDSLNQTINDWSLGEGNCVCCGVNRAVQGLLDESDDSKFRTMIVMTDGSMQGTCTEQGTGSAEGDAIKAACDAYNRYNITVYTIGFGNDADEQTLQQMASCGNGSYYYSDISEIIELYQLIAQEMIEVVFQEQIAIIFEAFSSKLYSDSYIEFNYTKQNISYGLIMTSEKQFSDEYYGYFDIPENSTLLETKVVSYSGSRWTDNVEINNTLVYRLSDYGQDYVKLGDPYAINIPTSLVQETNTVKVTTGLSPANSTFGSQYNKIIYTILRNIISYSGISAFAEGCIWTLEFEDNTNLTVKIPADYSGESVCYYQETSHGSPGEGIDAIQTAVYNLLKLLDFDNNGKLDVKFTEQNLEIGSSEITGIPYDWSTEVQVRKWY